MPPLPSGVAVQRATGSSSYVDLAGAIASTKLPNFPDTVTALQVNTILGYIANSSNAAEFRRAAIAESAVDIACAASDLIAFDESYSSVGVVAVMKFKRSPFSQYEYVEIPAPDASILDATRQYVNVSAGTGQSIVTDTLAALGVDACYTGSYITTRKVKRIAVRPRPALLEPEAAQLPSGLPDVDDAPGVQTVDAET